MTQETGDGASGGSASVEPAGDGAFDALAAAVGEGAYRLDAEGRFEAVNDVFVDLLGYDREELVGERFASLVAEEDVEAVESTIRALWDGGDGRTGDDGQTRYDGRAPDDDRDRDDRGGGTVGEVEASLRTASGELAPCSLRVAAVEADGRFAGTAGSLRVVADRQHEVGAPERERDVVESEFDEALDRVSDAFFALDREWRFTYLNEKAEELLDADREEIIGNSVWEEFEEAVDSTFYEEYHESMERQEPTSFVEFYPPISTWFEVVAYPGETGLSVYFRDVTDRVRRENELKHYETLVETVDDGLYAVDEDYRYTVVNDAYCELTGYDREELIGEPISKILDEETLEESIALRDGLLAGDDDAGSVETEIVRADGERVPVEASFAVIPGDPFRGTTGVVRDVSERKAFEEMLEALHVASRELHDAETSDDVADVVLETLTDVLDLPTATLFRLDDDAGTLLPVHQTGAVTDTGQDLPELPAGEGSLTGHVLETGEFHACDDVRETSFVDEPKTEMRAGLIAPLDEDRVLVVSSPEPGAFDERTERLVEILAGNASAAIERQERERELRESERRYRTLVDNFPGGAVALYDEECHYVAVGGQMYDRIDLSPDGAVGMTVGERLSGEIAEALESTIQRAFEGGSEEIEVPYDGRDFWLQSLPIRDDDGDVILAMVVTQDVTERKQAEEALEESERRFRTMMEQSPLSTQIFDPDGNAVMVNPAWEELWGASSEDMGEYNVLEDEQLEEKGLLSYLEKGFAGEATQLPTVYYDPEEIGKEGRPRWIEAFVYPVFDEAGDIREVALIHNDVTERKERERDLEQYRSIVETVDDGVFVTDGEGRIVFVNEAFVELSGHDREELIGTDASTLATEESVAEIADVAQQLDEGEDSVATVETELVTAEGETVPVETRVTLFELEDGEQGRVGVLRDITDRHERERALQQSERRYRTLAQRFPNGIVAIYDEELRFELVEGQLMDEWEDVSPKNLEGMSAPEVISAENRDDLEPALRAAFDGETNGVEIDSDDRAFEVWATPIRDDDGAIFAGLAFAMDVTDRRKREQELERYETAVDTASDVIVTIDQESMIRDVNPAVAEVFGYDPDELVGEPLTKLMPERMRERHLEALDRYLETGETALDWEYVELPGEHEDGHEFPLAISFGEFEYDGERFFTGIIRDNTERKERERELAEQRERYRGLVESAPVPIATYDAEGRLTYVNEAAVGLMGADDPDDLVGEPAIEFVHPDDRAETGERMRRVIEERELAPPRETMLVGLDGELRYAVIASAPVTEEGEPGGQVVLSDVTDRKEYERALEESEQRYRTLIENFPNGAVALVDQSMHYRTVGGSPLEVAGATGEELEGVPLEEALPPELADELVPRYEAALRGDPAEFEAEDDGRVYQFQFVPVRDDDGEVFAALGMSQDITERKDYERRLEESEQRYRTLVESYPGGAVAMFDPDLRYTVVGGQLLEAEGIDPEDRIGESIFDLYPEDLVEEVEPHFQAALEGESTSFEVRHMGRDLSNYTLPVTDADGEVFAGMLVVDDVTDRREYERRLERFQTMIETVNDGVYTIDADGYITTVNSAYAEMVGRHRDELIGTHATELVEDDVVQRAREIESELAEDPSATARLTAELKTDDDRTVIAEATFALLPGEDEDYERVAVVRDATERIEREAELERALDLLDRGGEIAQVAGWEIDAETQEVFWSDPIFDILGWPGDEIPPLEEALDVYHDEDRSDVEEAIEGALATGEPFDVDVRFLRDGEVRWGRIWGVPEVEDGEVVTLRGAFQDITERVEREAELERTLDLLERTEDIADVGGWEIDPRTQEIFWTEHTYELQGIPPDEEPPLEEALEVYHPEDRPIVEEAIERALEDGEPIDVEVRYTPFDGDEVRWFRILGVPEVEDGEVVSLRGAAQDVTERIRRERELRERVEQEDAVTQLGTLALEEPDLERLFDRATDLVAETLDNDLCKLLELQPDGDTLALRAGRGWDDGLVGSATLGTGDDSIAGRTLQTEEAIVVDDIEAEDPADRPDLLTDHGGRSGVSVIVGTPSEPWGVLGTYDTDVREFSRQDVNFVQSVANILGIAIERANREEELHRRVEQQQVVTDLGKKALEDVDLDRLFDEAVECVAETLDNEYAKVLELQPGGESLLLRSGVGWRDGLVGEGTVGTGDDSQAGHTIRSEEPIVVGDLATEERFSGPELLTSHGVTSGISTIIGPFEEPWGVLGTHDTERREYSQQDVNFVQSVANILATAIDRRTREREIERQRNRMAAIVRLSEIVQEVDQAVIEQSTREEIDRLVCSHLVESGEYDAAWVGDVNLASQTVAPRAAAGLPDDMIESVSFDADDEGDQGSPTAAAAATGEAWTSRADEDEDAFPAIARERGFRSMAAVPLAFEDVRYGVLTLFSDRESAFEGYERAVLEQLGRTVGHAINAIDRKQALVGDSFTEIELRFPGVVESLGMIDTADDDHTITVEGTVPADEGRVIQYVTITGVPPERFREAVDVIPTVERIRQIGGDGPNYRYEVTYSDPRVISMLSSYGGRLEAVSFDVPDLCITAALPPSADVRQIVGSLRSEFPDLRIDAQRTVTREHTSAEEHRNAIEEALTERQRTALMTAFFAGYFEWSRESTGEEVAETLGVSPSTFHQHLRAAQRKVISTLFDGERSG